MLTYKASGYVLGKLWGGGIGGYPAENLTDVDLTGLDLRIKQGIESGSLDSGMGFNGLIGAMMIIDTVDEREIDGKLFTAHTYTEKVYGDLTDEQIDLMCEAQFNS